MNRMVAPRFGDSILRRLVVGLLIATSLLGVGVASAWATQSSAKSADLELKGKAQFTGKFSWYSRGDNHGGFRIAVNGGKLKDINNNDRSVKFQVKIEGYSAKSYTAPEDKSRTIPDKVYWSGDQTIIINGYYRNCQNNTIVPDNCNDWRHKTNPYV